MGLLPFSDHTTVSSSIFVLKTCLVEDWCNGSSLSVFAVCKAVTRVSVDAQKMDHKAFRNQPCLSSGLLRGFFRYLKW